MSPETKFSSEAKSHLSLFEALLAFQAEAPRLTKDEVAEVVSKRTGGKYTYKYTPLKTIMAEIQPLLTKHGFVWSTGPGETEQGKPTLDYKLTHVPSGEALEGTMPLMIDAQGAQAYGSALTYARRYALVSVLNLVADDDDGRMASQPRSGDARLLPKASRDKMVREIEVSGKRLDLVLGAVGLERAEDATVKHAKQIKKLLVTNGD
jgi:ERF superfamily